MKRLRILLLSLALLLLAAAAFAFWMYRELQRPITHTRQEQYIEIPRGSSPDEVIERISSAGVIGRSWPLRLYVRLSGAAPRLKAGEYRFPSPISPLGVLRKLEEGQQRLNRFTVKEGWKRWDIANALAQNPEWKLENSDQAFALMNDVSLIQDLDPQAKNLEGYLYPDTYNFPPNTTPRQLIELMVQRFRQVWKNKLADQALAAGKSVREVVTVASLIETEAKLVGDRPLIASVIYNRVKLDIPLGIDSTIIYASQLAGKWRNDGKVYQSDLDRESPYNTRKVRGLPPGPVASPGASSLEAALSPATTDYLFYVREPSRNDGAHNFYNNDADFQRGVRALREWERTRDANASATPSPSPASEPLAR